MAKAEPKPDLKIIAADLSAIFPELMLTGRDRNSKLLFLWALMQSGKVIEACKVAGIGRTRSWLWRSQDEAYAKACDRCLEMAAETLVQALFTRAVDGVARGVWHQGARVGEEREFSDTAAIFLLKGLLPKLFKDRVVTKHELSPAMQVLHAQWRAERDTQAAAEVRVLPPADAVDAEVTPMRPRPVPQWPPRKTEPPRAPEGTTEQDRIFASLDALNAIPASDQWDDTEPQEDDDDR